MKLNLERLFLKPDYTIGKLYVDGTYFCDTLEDRVRDLTKEKKVPGQTAIPAGVYEVIVNISPRFRRKLPRLLDVPGFNGILIHRGNTPEDTAGCILVGENREQGKVINSTRYELQLTGMLERAQGKGEKITVEIIQP
ncbi:MAG: DUF5675 family protein [Odoribacter sp.]|nr:DUF5675 family protein [Odoribacter sp.]